MQYLGDLECEFVVITNDQMSVEEVRDLHPRGILVSPGPGEPPPLPNTSHEGQPQGVKAPSCGHGQHVDRVRGCSLKWGAKWHFVGSHVTGGRASGW